MAIVLPVYNAEEYITDCLDSILAQTYPYWKAYCINDGSKDNTAFILDDYAKKDARIRVFHTPNAGAASARNFALNKIEDEEWISFIDADDYIGPSMYEFIFKAIGNEHIDYVRLFSRRTPQRYNPQAVNSDERKNVNYKIVTREEYFVNESVGGYTHSLFVKKGIVDDHQVSFPEKMVMLEDQAFSIACATHAKKILILDQPRNYFYYSGNESSITRTLRIRRLTLQTLLRWPQHLRAACTNAARDDAAQGSKSLIWEQRSGGPLRSRMVDVLRKEPHTTESSAEKA